MFAEIINHLWQSTIFAFAVALLTLTFRKNRAQVRHWLWLTASLKFLIPFALLINLGNAAWDALATKQIASQIAAPAISITMEQIAQPFSDQQSLISSAPHASHNWLLIAIVAVWAFGFAAVVIARLCGWLRICTAIKNSSPMDVGSPVEVRSSPALLEPGVVGLFRHTLLLPEGILQNLTPPQLEAVLAHELAHIRRRDNLTAALHMLVEAIFWFHPAVWWIGGRLVEERERACDETVLTLGNAPRDYAEAILNVCKLYVESPLLCVSGVTGASLKKRIHAILTEKVASQLTSAKKIALAAAAVVALALPIVIGILIAPQLRAQSTDIPNVSFEVASVKPDPDAAHYVGDHIDIDENDGYYTGTGLTPRYLIEYAYGLVGKDQLSGGPSWINSDKYVLNAKSDDSLVTQWKGNHELKDSLVRSEMRSLLADRFQLKISHVTKELPVFDLVIAKGGPKFVPSTDTNGDHHNNGHNEGDVEIEDIKNEPLKDLVRILSQQPEIEGRFIIDRTELTGSYSFALKWTRQRNTPVAAQNSNSSASSDAPSIWTALQEQLGLKLESDKGPVDSIVIEHIEKPSPN